MRVLPAAVLLALTAVPVFADPPSEVVGLSLTPIPEAVYAQLPRLTAGQGLLIDKVATGSPAERFGLRRHDIILSLNGAALNDADQFTRLLYAQAENAKLGVLRGGKEIRVLLALKEDDLPKGI